MNPQIPEELISAYFDGEVTPEERAAVEKLLASSEESQRELSETARLSALLHSFPRESAPETLATQVLQRTGALPLPVALAAPRVKERPGSTPVWPQVRAALVSALATAAVFLLVLKLVEPGVQTSSVAVAPGGLSALEESREKAVAVNMAAPESAAPEMQPMMTQSRMAEPAAIQVPPTAAFGLGAESENAADMPREPVLEGAELADGARRMVRKEAQFGAARSNTGESNPAGGNALKSAPLLMRQSGGTPAPPKPADASGDAVADTVQAPAAPQSAQMVVDNANSQLLPEPEGYLNPLANDVFLDNLQQGRMYTFVPQPADPDTNAGVVDLVVVDVDRAAETMQILLGKQQVDRRAQEKQGRDEELVVLYANAPADRIARALNDVTQHPDLFVGWSAQLPLELADANLSADKQAEKPLAQRDMDEAKQAVEAFVKRSRPAPPGSLAALAGSGPQAAAAQAADEKRTDPIMSKKDQAGVEVLRLPMNEGRLAYSGGRARGGVTPGNPVPNAIQQRGVASGFNLPQRAEASNRNIRMLFVLHPSPAEPAKDRK